jgi:hypothetical protein
MIKSKMRLIRTQSNTLDRWIASNYESHIKNEFDDGRPIDQVKVNVFKIRDDREDLIAQPCKGKHPQEDFLVRFSSDSEIVFTGINLEYFCGGVCIFDGSFFDGFEKQFTELYTHEMSIIHAHMYCAHIGNLNDDILFYIRNIILSEYNCNYL